MSGGGNGTTLESLLKKKNIINFGSKDPGSQDLPTKNNSSLLSRIITGTTP